MKILLISNMFPPYTMGGAEMAAHSLAGLLAAERHEVHVLTGALSRDTEGIETVAGGYTVERRFFKNVYHIYKAGQHGTLRKAIWHANDHFHPASERICGRVIEEFGPDIVNTHDLQGIGYNLLKSIGDHGVGCVQTLHDFGFICVSMNMFRHGHECPHQHLTCQASAALKRFYFEHIEALAFISPSQALLERYRPHLPRHVEARAIPLPLCFAPAASEASAAPTPAPAPGAGVQLLFVGQLEKWKGIDFLLKVLSDLARDHAFHLRILGGGGLLEPLRARYRDAPWVTLAGKVPPEDVAGFMTSSDLLLVPSIWFENAPLVISQALRLSLPVVASQTGGLGEMVTADVNGALLPPGDAVAWRELLAGILREPAILRRWRAAAKTSQASPEELTRQVVEVFERTAARARQRSAQEKPATAIA